MRLNLLLKLNHSPLCSFVTWQILQSNHDRNVKHNSHIVLRMRYVKSPKPHNRNTISCCIMQIVLSAKHVNQSTKLSGEPLPMSSTSTNVFPTNFTQSFIELNVLVLRSEYNSQVDHLHWTCCHLSILLLLYS